MTKQTHEIHGIDNARKCVATHADVKQAVTVTDGDGEVKLALSSSSFPAALTPAQARMIAGHLIASANRVKDLAGKPE